MRTTLAHLCIKTRDLQATEEFYTRALGCQKAFEFERNGRVFGFYLRISGNQFLEFFHDPDAVPPQGCIQHLCFEVENIDDAKSHLAGLGIETTEKKLGGDQSWQIWLKDPNGIPVELHEYTDKSSQRTGQTVIVDW